PASPPAGTGSRPGPLRRPTPAPPSAPIPSASPLAAAPPRPIMSSAAPPVPGEPQGSGLTVTLAPPPSLGQRQPSDKSADAVVAARAVGQAGGWGGGGPLPAGRAGQTGAHEAVSAQGDAREAGRKRDPRCGCVRPGRARALGCARRAGREPGGATRRGQRAQP